MGKSGNGENNLRTDFHKTRPNPGKLTVSRNDNTDLQADIPLADTANSHPKFGDLLPDGFVHLGVSPETNEPYSIASPFNVRLPFPGDHPDRSQEILRITSWDRAMKYAKFQRDLGQPGFRLPSPAEFKDVLEKLAIKEVFKKIVGGNTTASEIQSRTDRLHQATSYWLDYSRDSEDRYSDEALVYYPNGAPRDLIPFSGSPEVKKEFQGYMHDVFFLRTELV